MTEAAIWLVSLSIGPVQDFIDAALRTRDLWFGSHMLSQVSAAAAQAIQKAGGQLIFPSLLPEKDTDSAPLGVANRIVAEVRGSREQAQDVIEAGKTAARTALTKLINEAKALALSKNVPLRDDVWQLQAQPDDLLELYSSAVLMQQGDYAKARARLERLAAARKNSRGFAQSAAEPEAEPGFGLPKSSLDGRRETVLKEQMDKRLRLKLRMGEGEQLDLMGLVKRLAGGNAEQFTPTTRIALDPWLRSIETQNAALQKARDCFEQLAELQSALVTRVRGNKEQYNVLPFDGALMQQGVLDAALGRQGAERPEKEELEILQRLRDEVMPSLWQQHGHPCPYYVLLRADGDHMGKLLDNVVQEKHAGTTPQDEHHELSKRLARFAQEVPDLARTHYCAHCIYAGGDDMLLLVPLDTALALADELRSKFSADLEEIAAKANADRPEEDKAWPTLSVGLVVAHMQTPMGRVRRLAKEAEHLAKGHDGTAKARNALAVLVAPRSGPVVRLRMSWDDDPASWLGNLADLYRKERLPSGFPYELRQVAILVQGMEESCRIAQLELERILGRKNKGGGSEQVDKEAAAMVLEHAKNAKSFEDVCQQHLAARWLGARGEAMP